MVSSQFWHGFVFFKKHCLELQDFKTYNLNLQSNTVGKASLDPRASDFNLKVCY